MINITDGPESFFSNRERSLSLARFSRMQVFLGGFADADIFSQNFRQLPFPFPTL